MSSLATDKTLALSGMHANGCNRLAPPPPPRASQMDGGIAPDTIDAAAATGPNVMVAGTAIFQAKDPQEFIRRMLSSVEAAAAAGGAKRQSEPPQPAGQ